MTLAAIMALAIAVFFIGWLVNFKDGRWLWVAVVGAVVYVICWVLGLAPLR